SVRRSCSYDARASARTRSEDCSVTRIVHPAAIVVLLCCPVFAQAQATSHPCASEPEPVRRLACYDAAFGAPRVDPEVVEKRAVEEFGLRESEKRERDPMR